MQPSHMISGKVSVQSCCQGYISKDRIIQSPLLHTKYIVFNLGARASLFDSKRERSVYCFASYYVHLLLRTTLVSGIDIQLLGRQPRKSRNRVTM